MDDLGAPLSLEKVTHTLPAHTPYPHSFHAFAQVTVFSLLLCVNILTHPCIAQVNQYIADADYDISTATEDEPRYV